MHNLSKNYYKNFTEMPLLKNCSTRILLVTTEAYACEELFTFTCITRICLNQKKAQCFTSYTLVRIVPIFDVNANYFIIALFVFIHVQESMVSEINLFLDAQYICAEF